MAWWLRLLQTAQADSVVVRMRTLEYGNDEESPQLRSRPFAVLMYWKYAPRAKTAVALLGDFFDHSRQLLTTQFPAVFTSDL